MKRFLSLCGVLLCLCSACSPALAVDESPVETTPSNTTAPVESAVPDGYLPPDDFFSLYSADDYTVSAYSVQSEPNTPVTSASGLKGVLINLFGEYSPCITQLRYQSYNSNYTYVNDISYDVPWIASCVIFGVVLYCVFRLGGALLCKV